MSKVTNENEVTVKNFVTDNLPSLIAKEGTQAILDKAREAVGTTYESLGNIVLDALEVKQAKAKKDDGRRSVAYLAIRKSMDTIEKNMDTFVDLENDLVGNDAHISTLSAIIEKHEIQTGKAKHEDPETTKAFKAQFDAYSNGEKKTRTTLYDACVTFKASVQDHVNASKMASYKTFAEGKIEDVVFVGIAKHLKTSAKMDLAQVCEYFITNYGTKAKRSGGSGEKLVYLYRLMNDGTEFAQTKSSERSFRSLMGTQYPTAKFTHMKGSLEVKFENGDIKIWDTKNDKKGSLSILDLAKVFSTEIKGFELIKEDM